MREGSWAAVAASLVWMAAMTGRCDASDWVGFLGGPYRTACSDEQGLLQTWPAEGPPLLWQTDGLGRSFGEVLVVGDSLFAAGSTGGNAGVLQCLDVATGKQRWKVPALAGGNSTPAWDAGRIFLQSRGQVSCHDAKNGASLWQADPKKLLAEAGVAAAKIPTPGYSGPWVQSLLTHEGLVVVVLGQPQGLVLALDGATGKTRWVSKGERQAIGQSWSSASLVRCGKRDIIVAPTTGDLVAVDPLDGKVVWEERVYPPEKAANGGLYTWACPPAYGDGFLFAYAGYRKGVMFRLGTEGASIERAWDTVRIHPHQENVIAVNGLLFGTGSVFLCDIDANPSFLLDGKPVNELPSGTVQKWRAQVQNNPDKVKALPLEQVSPGRTLVCQDLKTGKILGARGVGAAHGFSNHLLTYADGRLYVAVSGSVKTGGFTDAVYLVGASPALGLQGRLTLPLTEILKASPKGEGWTGFYTRPQVAQGRLWVRFSDQLRVYDLRPRKQGQGEGGRVP